MKRHIAIIGGGSAALMLACELDPRLFEVNIYERNPAPARKFLVAGQGGLNITHSESPEKFIRRFSPSEFLKNAFSRFDNEQLVDWLAKKGIQTKVGSSGRVFPVDELKPVEVLNILLEHAEKNGARFHFNTTWKGFDVEGALLFERKNETLEIIPDISIFCVGGASWPVTGSKGDWLEIFSSRGIRIRPFEASNCAFLVKWPPEIMERIEGKALKNIAISCGTNSLKGEVVITRSGLEGSGIYPLSPDIRKELKEKDTVILSLDLKPLHTEEQLMAKLQEASGNNHTEKVKRSLNLPGFCVQLLKALVPKEEFLEETKLVGHIKSLRIPVYASGPVEDAISTTGGVDLDEIDEHFMLRKMPDHYVIGEMLDYDAPTGGYLLQSCFTMAHDLAAYLNSKK